MPPPRVKAIKGSVGTVMAPSAVVDDRSSSGGTKRPVVAGRRSHVVDLAESSSSPTTSPRRPSPPRKKLRLVGRAASPLELELCSDQTLQAELARRMSSRSSDVTSSVDEEIDENISIDEGCDGDDRTDAPAVAGVAQHKVGNILFATYYVTNSTDFVQLQKHLKTSGFHFIVIITEQIKGDVLNWLKFQANQTTTSTKASDLQIFKVNEKTFIWTHKYHCA